MDDRQERFERVYRTHGRRVLGYAVRRTERAEDAADVVAETFAVAWRRLDDLPAGDEARLWLYGVARRVLANQRRGRRRQARLADRLVAEVARQSVARPPGDGPDREAVGRAFRQLSDDDREVLGLVGWEGLARAEVARVLGCSRANVSVRLHRARARFARALAAEGVDAPQAAATAGHAPGDGQPPVPALGDAR